MKFSSRFISIAIFISAALLLTGGLLKPRPVFAQEPLGELSIPASELASRERSGTINQTGELQIQSSLYLSEQEQTAFEARVQELNLRYSWGANGKWASSRVTALAKVSQISGLNELTFHELFVGSPRANGFFVGRRLANWNDADRHWNLGLWQPLYARDSFQTESQGLTGIFFQQATDEWQIVAFASPVFIPTLTPAIEEHNGSLGSPSRWFRPLPTQIPVIGDRETPLQYKLKMPAIRELVTKPSLGLSMRWGSQKSGPWVNVALARKPMNEIFIRYDASLVAQKDLYQGLVEVTPFSMMHEVWSVDMGIKSSSFQASLSFVQDQPEQKRPVSQLLGGGFQSDEYQQQPQPLSAVAVHFETEASAAARLVRFSFDYLRAQSADTPDIDQEGIERSRLLPHRLSLSHAGKVAGEVEWTRSFSFVGSYTREFDQEGSIWNIEARYRPLRSWLLRVGANVIGVDRENERQQDNRFLNAFRQNDRVYGGLSYVF